MLIFLNMKLLLKTVFTNINKGPLLLSNIPIKPEKHPKTSALGIKPSS
jgi:hypothetical protein